MLIQLPNDVVATGWKETRPFNFEQTFKSESCGFQGTEKEFLKAGHAYEYIQIDRYTRRVY